MKLADTHLIFVNLGGSWRSTHDILNITSCVLFNTINNTSIASKSWEISKILSYFILPMECWWIKLSDQFLLNLFQFLKKKSLTTRIPGWFTMTSKIEHLNETLLKVHIKYFQSFKLKWNRNLSKHFEWFSFDHKYNSEER